MCLATPQHETTQAHPSPPRAALPSGGASLGSLRSPHSAAPGGERAASAKQSYRTRFTPPSPHEFILSASSPQKAALRVGNWKLILQPGETDGAANGKAEGKAKGKAKNKAKNKGKGAPAAEPVALYDLAGDPGETTNLAKREPERVAEMRAKLEELLKNAVLSGADAAEAE